MVQFGSTFSLGTQFICAERLDGAQSKETPGAFHVTEGPLFSIFISDISSESVIPHSSPGDLKRREGGKDGSMLTGFKWFCKNEL